jgi:hypothetical protein
MTGETKFDSQQGHIFLNSTASRAALLLARSPIQWMPRGLSSGVKRPWREADYSP